RSLTHFPVSCVSWVWRPLGMRGLKERTSQICFAVWGRSRRAAILSPAHVCPGYSVERETRVRHVGQGQGNYTRTQDMLFVGHGQGAYEKERVHFPRYSYWAFVGCCLGLLAVGFILLLGYLLAPLLHNRSGR
ncbi:unnamed protein product, partial [Effrenium voratum]